MSRCQQVARPLLRSLRQASSTSPSIACRATPVGSARSFSSTPSQKDESTTTTTTSTPSPDSAPPAASAINEAWLRAQMNPETAVGREAELKMMQQGTPPIGSRRRRAAIALTGDLPFEQLPYQAFQEARKILYEDRQEKLAMIKETSEKIARIEAMDASTYRAGEYHKQKKLKSLRMRLEELKILADINDPLVKRRFEDGLGDMTKPIYRYLAEKKWRSMDFKVIEQRIEQFNIVPDILPKFSPKMDVKLYWRGYRVPPGSKLESRMTEVPPSLHMRVFDAGERLMTVVVLDSDVPDAESDGFSSRLHFIATNIPWDPTKTSIPLGELNRQWQQQQQQEGTADPSQPSKSKIPGDVAVPWLPPTAQKGAPYHRLSVFVLEHAEPNKPIDAARVRAMFHDRGGAGRANFNFRRLMDKLDLTPVGFSLFRTEWDAHTPEVMERHGIAGGDVEFRHQRVHSLKPPRKARGWEAKRQKPKYRSLWKYTKRIAPGRGGS